MSTSRPADRRRTRKPPALRSAEILDAAIALAREDGLSAITLRAVAERAGVAPSLTVHYHPSADDLVARAFTALVAEELGELRALTAARGSAAAGLGALLTTVMDGSRATVTVIWVEAWALGRRNAVLARAVREQMGQWQHLVRALVERGTTEGDFVVDDADAAAWQLIGMVDGLNAQSLVSGRHDQWPLFLRTTESLLGASRGALRRRDPGDGGTGNGG